FPDRCEYSRYHCPIGSLAVPRASGTVSATGARLTFTPAPASCSAQRVASWVSSASGRPPWSIAEGISSKPAPCSCCTEPPSWSAAMNRPRPPVADSEASPARWLVVGSIDACPSCQPPSSTTPPRWRSVIRSSRLLREAPASRPTQSSCPACSAGDRSATICSAHVGAAEVALSDAVGSGDGDGLSLGVALAEVSLSPDGCEVDGAPSLGAGPVGEVQPTAPSSTALSSAAPPVQCRAIRWRRPTAPALPRSSRIEVVIITEG